MNINQIGADYRIFQLKQEKKWQALAMKAVRSQLTTFTEYAQLFGYQVAVDMMHASFPMQPLIDVIKRLYAEAGTKWGKYTNRYLRTQKRMILNNIDTELFQFMQQYFVENFGMKFTDPVSINMRDYLQKEVIGMLQYGNSFEEITRAITRGDIATGMRTRVLRIVRTETVRASNAGGMAAAKSTRLVLNKTWISAQDNRTRRLPRDGADHLHLNGVSVGIDETFAMRTEKHGTQQAKQPGDPALPGECTISCRCTLGFQPQRDARGRLIRN